MIKALRHRLGQALRRFMDMPLQEFALERLREAGFRPRELLDVGASYGLFPDEVWPLWPELKVHCFEPEPEYIERLNARAKTDSRLTITHALVGARPEKTMRYYYHLGASSICKEHVSADPEAPAAPGGPERSCQMITLDDYCSEKKIKPDFLKIDVQGYELEVLKGAEKILPEIEVILTEVNHIGVYAEAPLAAELIRHLADRGYALHDICNFTRLPRASVLWQTDMIFVRHSSPLRRSKAWGA